MPSRKKKAPLTTNTTDNQITDNAASNKENLPADDSKRQLALVLAHGFKSYTVEQMQTLEKDFNLRHVDFVDLVVAWIQSGKHTQKDGKYTQEQVMKVWGKIRKKDLELWYYYYLTKTFEPDFKDRSDKLSYRLPDGMLRIKHKYERECFVINELCKHNLHFLFNKETVVFFSECDVCGRKYDIQLRLTDEQPCYDLTQEKHAHSLVHHWYIVYEEDSTCRMFSSAEYNTYYSMVTNTRAQVIAKIEELLAKGKAVGLYCMFQCNGAKFTKTKAKGHSHGPKFEMVD